LLGLDIGHISTGVAVSDMLLQQSYVPLLCSSIVAENYQKLGKLTLLSQETQENNN
jgi:RNase H-fold protein (predicted Holliday junction resolvase)